MIHLFINARAASAGGGLTYVRNLVPQLAEHEDVRVTMLLSPSLRAQLASYRNGTFIERKPPGGVGLGVGLSNISPNRFVGQASTCFFPLGIYRMFRGGAPHKLATASRFRISVPVSDYTPISGCV
jgi:hypothetical protein